MRIREAATYTAHGAHGSFNSDAVLWLPELPLLAVADGVGGPGVGNVASSLALLTLGEHRAALADAARDASDGAAARHRLAAGRALEDAIRAAHEAVAQAARKAGEPEMVTSVCAALLSGNRAVVAHVGDCRAYLIRDGALRLVTEDHTVGMLRLRKGLIAPEVYRDSPLRYRLYQAVGAGTEIDVDVAEIHLADRDVLLLCSDGLHRFLDDGARSLVGMLASAPSLTAAAAQLVQHARDQGADDDASVVVVKVDLGVGGELVDEITRVMGEHFLFRGLSEPERAIVAPYIEHRVLEPGEVLFQAGDPGASFFCVVDGTLAITHEGTHLVDVGPGGHLGELTLARPAPRSATVTATTEALLFELTRARFHEILRRRPNIGAAIALAALDRVGDRLRDLTDRIRAVERLASGEDAPGDLPLVDAIRAAAQGRPRA